MNGSSYELKEINPENPSIELSLAAKGNSMDSIRFDKSELRVREHTTIRLTLINESNDSSMKHNFVLVEEGSGPEVASEGVSAGMAYDFVPKSNKVLIKTSLLGPGEVCSITFTAPQKGNYDYICSFPGHAEKMAGRFIVE
ncbi:MAG: azurin [Bacteroidetes bacterium]|nr:azurin [Bacteroidota bacterium]